MRIAENALKCPKTIWTTIEWRADFVKSRFELIGETRKLFGDVRNSVDQVQAFCEADNAEHARAALKLMTERIERATAAFNVAFPDVTEGGARG